MNSPLRPLRPWTLPFCGLLLLLQPQLAPAAVFTWSDLTGGTWSDPGNWSGGNVPPAVATDARVNINDRSSTYTVDYDVESTTLTSPTSPIRLLTLGNTTGAGTVTFQIAGDTVGDTDRVLTLLAGGINTNFSSNASSFESGSIINVTGGLGEDDVFYRGILNTDGLLMRGNAQLNIDGGTVNVTGSGQLQGRFGAQSITTISEGGLLNIATTTTVNLGVDEMTDNALIHVNGGTVTSAVSFSLGTRGTGTLRVDAGEFRTTATSAGLTVGQEGVGSSLADDHHALVELNGGEINNMGALSVGRNTRNADATAVVNITGGVFTQLGTTAANTLAAEVGVNNDGEMNISGTGEFHSTGRLSIGTNAQGSNVAAGNGLVTVDDNGLLDVTNAAGDAQIIIARSENDGAATGLLQVNGGTVEANRMFVNRGGALEINGGVTNVDQILNLTGNAGGAGSVLMTDGELNVNNADVGILAELIFGDNASFIQNGGTTFVEKLTYTNPGVNLAINGGTFTVQGTANVQRGMTIGGGAEAARMELLGLPGGTGPGFTYNTQNNLYAFTNPSQGSIVVGNNGTLYTEARLGLSKNLTVQDGGVVDLNPYGPSTDSVNNAPLFVDQAAVVDIQTGGTFSTRGGTFDNGSQLVISGGDFIMDREATDGFKELRFSRGSSLTMTGGTFTGEGAVGQQTILRLGSNAAGKNTANVSGGTMTITALQLGDRGNTAAGENAAGSDATFNLSGDAVVNINSGEAVGGSPGAYIGANPQNNVNPFSRAFFNQSGGTVNNSNADLRIGNNTMGGNNYGTLNITGGTWNQNGAIAYVGYSGTSTTASASTPQGRMVVSGSGQYISGNSLVIAGGGGGAYLGVGGDVTLSGNGKISTSGEIRSGAGATGIRNFNFDGGILAVRSFDATNLGRATTTGSNYTTTGIGALTNNGGVLSPGDDNAGLMTLTGDYNVFSSAARLSLNIYGDEAATFFNNGTSGFYDRIEVAGSILLDGGIDITVGAYTPTLNSLYFVMLNDEVDAILGQFTGLEQGAIFGSGGQMWQISYQGNSELGQFTGGNDLALLSVPEPSASLMGLAALLACASLRRRRTAVTPA